MKSLATFKKNLISFGAASMLAVAVSMTLTPSVSFAAVALEAQMESGLPVPTQNTMKSVEQTPFMVTSQTTVSAGVEDVAAFYRAELAKLNWTEDKSKEVMSADGAALAFMSPDGPAQLTLVKSGDNTEAKLFLRKVEAAKKSGLMPGDGQTKVMLGNFLDGEAVMTINNQSIKIAAHAGETGFDGPSFEMKPGTYAYKVEAAGQEPMTAELVVGENEIWGLMVGPGGVLPVQMY
jgi:hypothetical protein